MIRIVTDSGTNLPFDLREQYGIITIPLIVIFGARSHRDEVDLSNDQFYEMLQREKVHPTTSTPSPADFINVWRPILQAGDEIVSLHLPANLSATYGTAVNAKKQLDAEYGRDVPITIVDSSWVSVAMGFQALEGARAARAGKSREEIAAVMRGLDAKMWLIFVLDTLEYLRRGGRIGKATAFLGGVFSIKPVAQIAHGEVDPLERVRSLKAGMGRLIDLVGHPPPIDGKPPTGSGPLHVTVLHAANPEGAQYLEDELRARFNIVELYKANIGPVIAVHSGPRAVGMAFYRE